MNDDDSGELKLNRKRSENSDVLMIYNFISLRIVYLLGY